MLIRLLLSLLLTLALEEVFALLWGLRGRRTLELVALANCLTNPLVNVLYALSRLRQWPALPVIAVLEAAAVLAEWRLYRRPDSAVRRPLLFSLCANGFSYCAGFLLQILL